MSRRMLSIPKVNRSFLSLALLTLGMVALLAQVLAKLFPLATAKIIYFCQKFISETLFPIPHSLPYGIVFGLGAIAAIGGASFLLQLTKTHRLLQKLLRDQVPVPEHVQRIIDTLHLGNRVHLVRNQQPFSFCAGSITPHIIMTTALVSTLDDKELEAVLFHEQFHLRHRDPLKILFGKTVSVMFFFLPIFSELSRNMVGTNELLADAWTTAQQGETKSLRGALKKILIASPVRYAGVAAIANPDHLEVRVYTIAQPQRRHQARLSPLSIMTSIVFIVISWLIIRTPVNAFSVQSTAEPSYFVCSSTSMCSQQCQSTAETSVLATPHALFSSPLPSPGTFLNPSSVPATPF